MHLNIRFELSRALPCLVCCALAIATFSSSAETTDKTSDHSTGGGAVTPTAPALTGIARPELQQTAPAMSNPPAGLDLPPAEAPMAPSDEGITVKALPLSELPPPPADPKQVEVQIRQADLWARIRSGFKMPDLKSPLVEDRQTWYAGRPDYMQRMTERSSRYLYFIVEEIERRGMPMELALLPFVESAFNPQALSTAKASGMWQFIPSTGKDYRLTQNMWKDERRSVTESTRAALDYFEKLYRMFGDWHLALASYNWGEGSVSRAVARAQREGLGADYLSLNMPAETRYYVPKLQALKNLILNPEAYNITLPEIPNQPYFVTITKVRDIDVTTAAKMADMSVDHFRALNPSFNRPVILGASRPEILLPADKVNLFLSNVESANGKQLSSWMAYTIGKTERTASIAQRFGISEVALREANRIPPKMRIRPGSTLLVPRPQHVQNDISAHVAENASLMMEPDLPAMRRVTHTVRKGESMASIARRYRVSLVQLKAWNGGRGTVSAGQRISVQVAAGGKRSSGIKRVTGRPLAGIKARAGKPVKATAKSSRKTRK
jgi:membrane-bound lytic murein transglycosylase D